MWKKNLHSRGEIDHAGEIIRAGVRTGHVGDYLNAFNVMDTWRASHAFPLNTIQMTLRRRSKFIDPDAEVVQRLKRAPSAISKLRRNRKMKLSRIQDLGGCRSIVSEIEHVYAIREMYRQSSDRHQLANEKDYIKEPKDSGYRGIHVIYKYVSDRNTEYNGHRIELQFRTAIQHAWATAVEIAGIYVRTSLKSSIGPEPWLEFFRYASSAFSDLERTPRFHHQLTYSDVVDELRSIDKSIDARHKLRNFTIAHDAIRTTRRKSDSHFILTLDLSQARLALESFSSLAAASEKYAELEKRYIDNELVDVVLVSADSIEGVAKGYPNYFADTTAFLALVDKMLD